MTSLLCPVLVGRDADLRQLADAMRAGGTVVVTGEAGIGKSALVREALRRAAPRSVLTGRSLPGTADGLRPLREVALAAVRAGADPGARALRLYRRAIEALLPAFEPAGSRGPDPLARSDSGDVTGPFGLVAAEALLGLVSGLPAPVAVVLEDLHWADSECTGAIEFMADQASSRRVALVCTARPAMGSPALDMAHRLGDRRTATLIQLGPLGAPEVTSMIAACLAADRVPEDLAGQVRRLSDGLPLLVEELLRSAASSGALREGTEGWQFSGDASGPLPRTVETAVRARLGSLAARDRHVLVTAAVLGREPDARLLATTSGADPGELDSALAVGARVDLLDPAAAAASRLRFRHALTRDAVLATVPPADQAETASRALAVIERSHPGLDGDWLALAAGLAAVAGEEERAARLLCESGLRAMAYGALGSAADALRAARPLAGRDVGLLAEIAETLVAVLSLAGDADQSLREGRDAQALLAGIGAPADRQAGLLLALARAQAAAERWDEAAAQLAAADAAIPRRSASRAALQALIELGRQRHEAASLAAREALDLASRTPDPAAECQACEVLGRLARREDLDQAREWFSRAVATAIRAGLASWRARALHELATIDQLRSQTTEHLEEARAAAVDAGAPGLVAAIDFHIAAVRGVRFESEAALEAARRCLDLCRRIGSRRRTARAWILIAQAHAMAGRRSAAEAAAREATGLAGDEPEVAGLALACRGMASLLLEERGRAVRELEGAAAVMRRIPGGPEPVPPWYIWPLLAVLEDRDGAAVLAETEHSALRVAKGPDGMWRLASAVAAGKAGDRELAEGELRAAETSFAVAAGMAGYRHLGLRLAAEAALADGWGEPVRWLTEAESFFASQPLPRVAAACRALLSRAGMPQRRRRSGDQTVPAGLAARGVTGREAEVLALVAEGLTNRQIGERLYLAPRTVKGHLESLFAKTGQSGRAALASLAVAEGLTGEGMTR